MQIARWVPSAFTLGNLTCGLLALTAGAAGTPTGLAMAAWLLGLAMICDAADGRVARRLGATSPFGVELDSLADVVSFGVVPAFLVLRVSQPGPASTIGAVALAAAAALRLARFNVTAQSGQGSSTHFTGCPVPIPAAFVAGLVLHSVRTGAPLASLPVGAVLLLASVAMVSRFPYPSFKHAASRRQATAFGLGAAALGVGLLACGLAGRFDLAALAAAGGYLAWGPLGHVARSTRARRLSP